MILTRACIDDMGAEFVCERANISKSNQLLGERGAAEGACTLARGQSLYIEACFLWIAGSGVSNGRKLPATHPLRCSWKESARMLGH